MPLKIRPMRYAHPEGHTDVCYFDGERGGLVTCGGDGDVRFWLDLMDDDPSAVCVAEQATACVSKKSKIYVGNDNNSVQILTHPNLDREGILTRFTATVSSLVTSRKSNLIVSGACDMRIQVTNIETNSSVELTGHEAPILGLTLDPLEEFVSSSSADGSIKVWSIKEKKSVHTWSNVVPKCNSFFTAKAHCTPSFNAKDGSWLAYSHQKDVVFVERNSWRETNRFKCPTLKTEINICKSSECGTRIAACSIVGEIVVWSTENSSVIGYVEHSQSAKITSLVWNLKKPSELAFCDSLGQLGCVDVTLEDGETASIAGTDLDNDNDNDIYAELGLDRDDDDDDNENVISLNKIKATVDDDQKSVSSMSSAKASKAVAEVNMQEPFQPGSTPVHLLSRFMVWNDVGIVKCYTSEDSEDSSIDVEFHDASVHHGMNVRNYLKHTIASLSCETLAMSCPSNDGTPSKLVVISLQGWGSGNKEWSADLPEDEESVCVAAGSTFVALATSKGNLRLFLVSGVQREIIALPGPVVAMNAVGNQLVVACHKASGFKDQFMSLLWIQVRGSGLKSREINLPLTPGSELMWLGLSDAASPVVMDADGVIRIFHKQSNLWRVAADTDKYPKGKMDHYFIVGVSEREKLIRCILCKGSRYPPTTPRPNVIEVDLKVPLCDPDTEKTKKEANIWQIGANPSEETTALFTLIAFFCEANTEFRVVDLCQNTAELSVIELAVKYATRSGKMALAKKLQAIAEEKNRKQMAGRNGDVVEEEEDIFTGMDETGAKDTQEDIILTPIARPTQDIVIRPSPFSLKKKNPFLKKTNSPGVKGLDGLNSLPEKAPKTPVTPVVKTAKKSLGKKESFVKWYERNKADLEKEFPNLSGTELSKVGHKRYKEENDSQSNGTEDSDSRKRKLSSPENDSQAKKSTDYKPLDPIQDAMGIMGRWQIIITVAISLINFPAAWHQLSIAVLAPGQDFTCVSPPSFNTSASMLKACKVQVNESMTVECDKFEYDTSVFKSTIISQKEYIVYGVNESLDEKPLDPIQDAMGAMGHWQIIITIAISLINFPAAWNQLAIAVIAPRQDFTCVSPLPINPNDSMLNTCFVKVNESLPEVECEKFTYDDSAFKSTIVSQASGCILNQHDLVISIVLSNITAKIKSNGRYCKIRSNNPGSYSGCNGHHGTLANNNNTIDFSNKFPCSMESARDCRNRT
ncbi:hypothetical protein G9C98_002635 [Cotesia typhae]|uniref:WD repeat-containing protein 55 homolog n=1 Tax=Cotesia typhae TaxID=2053667 RepID=A0A8J5VCC9_9HYME|nr:hypothetical protein G9C98_002635 [Cotesia typhae]